MKMIEIVKEIGVPGFLDIAFVSILTYAVFIWFKKTKSALVLVGIFIVGTIYLLADHFNMVLTTSIFQGFFAVILVALVVIFQEELRHFFELVAVWSLDRRLMRKKVISSFSKEVQVLARTLWTVELGRSFQGSPDADAAGYTDTHFKLKLSQGMANRLTGLLG